MNTSETSHLPNPSSTMTEPRILEPHLEYAFTIQLKLKPKISTGPLPRGGDRYFVEVTEGRIFGPRLQGIVLPGGGDWAHHRPDGTLEFDARYNLELADGSIVCLQNRGYRWGSADAMAKMARRQEVAPSEYYMRVSPTFEVGQGPHEWLARHVFVGIGDKVPEGNFIHYYIVL